jgi:hypothetical protein
VEKPDHRHRRLLRARHERPSCRRAAEQRDELAPSHCLASARGYALCLHLRPSNQEIAASEMGANNQCAQQKS